MSLWTRLFPWRRQPEAPAPEEPQPTSDQVVSLPNEPFVFECQSCGKVFEARRKRPLCPECDSIEVQLLSE